MTPSEHNRHPLGRWTSPISLDPALAAAATPIDLTGKTVRCFGHVWTVTGRNYMGDWSIVRQDHRTDGVWSIGSSMPFEQLSPDHPHHWELVDEPAPALRL